MGSPAVAAALAKSFEPILLFHKDEAFFPIDPKWYLERCALWKSTRPFDDKTRWVQPPNIAKASIAALNGPKELVGGKTWIGAPGGDFGVGPAPIGERTPPNDEHFLEFVGWDPPSNPPVTPATSNRHAALTPADYLAPLQGSQPWYYVEYLDNADLRGYADNPNVNANGLNLFSLVATNPKLNAPRLLIYHLLYPLHQETLEGCKDAGEGRLFGSYAGEWASIGIVIDATGKPLFIGLTSRNTASTTISDQKLGLTVFDWSAVQTVTDQSGGLHAKIFVSLDTHGHYPTAGSQPVTPFTPGGLDVSRMSCGEVEKLDDVISSEVVAIAGTPATSGDSANGFLIVLKIVASMGALGFALFGWSDFEHSAWGSFGADATPDILATPQAQPTDVTGGPAFGRILRPQGLMFAEAGSATSVDDWNVRSFSAPDGRAYGFVVERATQVWWAPRPTPRAGTKDLKNPKGFSGRWGPRVTNDPNARRAGMKCPDFALLLMEALAVKLNT